MAIVLLNLYRADTGRWYALLTDDSTGQIAELKYASKPSAAQAKADVQAVFNPPTVNITAEDGTVIAAVAPQGFAITLTAGQKTAIANAETTLGTLVNAVQGKLGNLPDGVISQLRAHSPLLDGLMSLGERLRQ